MPSKKDKHVPTRKWASGRALPGNQTKLTRRILLRGGKFRTHYGLRAAGHANTGYVVPEDVVRGGVSFFRGNFPCSPSFVWQIVITV
jgi:hypothetical protein